MSEPAPDRVRVRGPLAKFAAGFRERLSDQGYSLRTTRELLQLLAHLSRWMEAEGLEASSLTPAVAERFIIERRRQGYRASISPRSGCRLLGDLEMLGAVPPSDEAVFSSLERLLGAFCRYLREERGMANRTVAAYEAVARLFLSERSEPIEEDLARLSGAEINAFVLRESRRRSQRSAERVVCGLRALLRYLHTQGLIAKPLVAAVPSVANRREDLPRGLAVEQAKLLLESCDRSTPVGRRDYAVLSLLARLGLRCGEVAALTLDDIDWRAGELVIRGKGSRVDRLPLPSDVGEALADYLCRGRPRGFGRTLFVNGRAPVTAVSRHTVSMVVVRACRRVGMPPVRAHRLRHAVASELLRRGAGLAEIGQVLRHQDLRTTAIYAKVDRAALSSLALPWPGSGR
jgi:integrase/recombinase XerD